MVLSFLVDARCFGQAAVSVHLTLGNPSHAKCDPETPDNYLVVKDQWACSFNRSTGSPNWVSWRLAADDLGRAQRENEDFHPEPVLPEAWPKVTAGLYARSGFDLGHVCPAGDRTRHMADLRATFSTANCFPQSPPLNRGAWAHLEYQRRKIAQAGNELYIIAGPAGTAGRGSKGYRTRLGDADRGRPDAGRQVNVPALCWAAFVVLADQPGDDLARVTAETPVTAVIFRNDPDGPRHWHQARTTVDEIEELTGLDLFDLVPVDVQSVLESRQPATDEKGSPQRRKDREGNAAD